MCQGSVGGSAVGWPPLAIICYLPPSENLTCWEMHSLDQGRPRETETPEKKREQRATRANKSTAGFMSPFYTSVSCSCF